MKYSWPFAKYFQGFALEHPDPIGVSCPSHQRGVSIDTRYAVRFPSSGEASVSSDAASATTHIIIDICLCSNLCGTSPCPHAAPRSTWTLVERLCPSRKDRGIAACCPVAESQPRYCWAPSGFPFSATEFFD